MMQQPAFLHPRLVSMLCPKPQDVTNNGPLPANLVRLCCSKCRFFTRDRNLYERHLAQHEGITFSCNVCGHLSYSKVESQRHAVQHSGRFPFKCSFCSYGAVRRDYILKHINRVHSETMNFNELQAGASNILAMGGVPVSSVPNNTTLIGVVEQSLEASRLPVRAIPSQNMSQWNTTNPFGSLLGEQGVIRTDCCEQAEIRTAPRIQQQFASAVSNRGFLLTDRITAGKTTQSISVRPNGTNHLNINLEMAPGASKVITSLNRCAITGPNTNIAIPSQSSHVAVSHTPNTHLRRRSPPLILRKSKQRQAVLAPNFTNTQVSTGSRPVLSTNETVLKSRFPSTVISYLPSQNFHLALPPSLETSHLSAHNTSPDIVKKMQATKGIVPRTLVSPQKLVSQTSVRTSDKKSCKGGQTVFGTLNVLPVSGNHTIGVSASMNNSVDRCSNLSSTGPVVYDTGSIDIPAHQPQLLSSIGQSASMTVQQALASLNQQRKPSNEKPRSGSPLNVELLEPLNQPLNPNRTLTVSYPEELNIPPGSLVEVVQVKDVSGGQELQLRVVSRHTNGYTDKIISNETAVPTPLNEDGESQKASAKKSTTVANTKVDSCKTAFFSDKGFRVPSKPTNKPQSESKVCVKEEPPHPVDLVIPAPPFSLAHPSDGNGKQLHLPSSPTVANSPNFLPMPSKSTQQSNTPIQDKEASTFLGAKQCCSDNGLDAKGLPVILAVYSLGQIPESLHFPISASQGAEADCWEVGLAPSVGDDVILPSGHVSERTLRQSWQEPVGDVVTQPHNKKTSLWQGNSRVTYQDDKNVWETVFIERANPVDKSNAQQPNTHRLLLCARKCSSAVTVVKPQIINGVCVRDIDRDAYKQLFRQIPKVSLARISSKYLQVGLNEGTCKKCTHGSILRQTALLSFDTGKPNISIPCKQPHEMLKLRLKRKKCGTEKDTPDIFEALPLTVEETNIESVDSCEPSRKESGPPDKRLKLCGVAVSNKRYLTPVKDNQCVKYPGPNQPVVVLNHPSPLCQRERKHSGSPVSGVGVAPLRIVLSGEVHRIIPEIVKSPSLKMTFKKVQGDQYQVTELLAEGISDNMGV